MADPAEIRAEGRRLWADYSESDETGVTRDEWERWWYFHADVLLADPSPKCRRIGGPVTLAQSLHMVQPGQEIPKLVFDVCEQVLERFTVCVPAPAPADVLLTDPAPVGLTEDERRNVEWIRRWCAPTSEHLGTLLAIIDRLSAAPPVVPEPSCRHAVYHHGCLSCDRQDPEERL